MNLETEQNKQALCTIKLSRKDATRKLSFDIHNPEPFATQPSLSADPDREWGCMVDMIIDGMPQRKMIYSVSWLSSFLLALKFARSFIPQDEECEWIDDDGVESWCVLPRFVPFSWGYDLYQRISRMTEETEREFEEDVQRRRLAWEKRREQRDGK